MLVHPAQAVLFNAMVENLYPPRLRRLRRRLLEKFITLESALVNLLQLLLGRERKVLRVGQLRRLLMPWKARQLLHRSVALVR